MHMQEYIIHGGNIRAASDLLQADPNQTDIDS